LTELTSEINAYGGISYDKRRKKLDIAGFR